MIPFETLVAWVTGEVADADLLAVEEHLLGCEPCARTAGVLLELQDGIAALVRTSALILRGHREVVRRAEEEGLVTRRYRLRPSEVVPCTVAAGERFTLMEYLVDPGKTARIDLIATLPGGGEERLSDVPYDPDAGVVRILHPASELLLLPTARVPIRLVAGDGPGERILGTYTLDHRAPA